MFSFDVCMEPQLNMNGKFFSTKRLQLLQAENLGKIQHSCVPAFPFGAGLLMREHSGALFDLLSWDLGGGAAKFPPNPCGLSGSWLEPEPGASAAPGEICGSMRASNSAAASSWGI